MKPAAVSEGDVWKMIRKVKDPEIPALNVVEMGIVRSLQVHPDRVCIQITPTYCGCPAMEMIEREIVASVSSLGIRRVEVHLVYSPAWSSDSITPAGREKLATAGIAPPCRACDSAGDPTVICPFCGSTRTRLQSWFGSTACKSLFFCDGCRQPFEYFKEI